MYDVAFKLHVCKAKEEHPEKTYKQIGAEYGLNSSTVSDWYRRYRLYGENAFDPEAQRLENEKQLLKLMKEVDDLREENEILKKSDGLLCEKRPVTVFVFMWKHRDEYTIARMAKVLGVSESGYYRWLSRPVFAPSRDGFTWRAS